MNVRRPPTAAIAALLTLLLAPGALWSWGRTGHRASALLAESRLTPAALAAIRSLLEPGEDLAGICTWADQQREIPRTGPWHYVNVPSTESRYDARFCPPEDCGSMPGYYNLLEVTRNPTHKEYEDMMDWLGGEYDPDAFSVDDVNRRLAPLQRWWAKI